MAAFEGSKDSNKQAAPVDAGAGLPDLVDQAVKAELDRRQQNVDNRSWLSSAVHTVSDRLTHALGGGDSDQTAAALERLQSQYHHDLAQGKNTDQLKTQIYSTIAKDESAQSREDTNAGYGAEFLKAAALFAPRTVSPFATGIVTAFDQTNNLTSATGIAEFGLGFGKGFALSKIYSHIGSRNWSAPMQGIALGVTSRGLDLATDLNTYKDRQGNWSMAATGEHLGSLANLQSLGTDAAVFTVAHGMFKLGNAATGNALQSGLASKMFTAGSFGLVSDATGEAQRQIQQNGSVTNWGAVIEHGVVGSVINAAGGGISGAPSETGDFRTARSGRRAEAGAGPFPDLIERSAALAGPDPAELARRGRDLRLLDNVGHDQQVPYRWGGSVTRRGDLITSMTDATGHKFVYDYSRSSKEHPQRVIFPDGRTAERVVDKATPVWHEFDAQGQRTQVHNDVYKVLGDGSLMRYNEDDNYRATTWRTDGAFAQASGVDEHITFPSGKQAVVSSPMFLVVRDGASPLFRVAVDRTLQAIPRPLRELMQERGQKIILGRSLTSVFPELKGERLRGWGPKETWDLAEGGTFGDDVVLGEFKKNSAGRDVPTERAPGVLRHEASHGLNAALGENGQNYSDSPDFIAAHTADFADMPETVRRKLAYMLQPDGEQPSAGGRDEAFAELSGIGLGGGSAPWLQSDILRYFPRTNQVVTRRLNAEISARSSAQ